MASIDTYTDDDGETYYDGHIANYEPWDPPLPLTPELAERVSFISPDRLGVGQAGIRKIERGDFTTILGAYQRGRNPQQGQRLVPGDEDELWTQVVRLEGQRLHTLARPSPFKIATATDEMLILELEEGTRATIPRDKLEGAYAQLMDRGEILRSEIEEFFPWDSSYATAILASLPNVQYETGPLRLRYDLQGESSPSDLEVEAPPVSEEIPGGRARELVRRFLQSHSPMRPVKAVRSRTLFRIESSLVWLRYSKFYADQEQYWLGIPKKHYEKIKDLPEPIYVLLICGHPDRTLVVPFGFLESVGITSAPVNSNGEWILYVYASGGKFELALWTSSGQRKRFDVAGYLNNYEPVLGSPVASEAKAHDGGGSSPISPEVEVTRKGPVQTWELVPPGPLFEKSRAGTDVPPRAHESESRRDSDIQARIDTEFEQVRRIIEDSLIGETIYTLAQHKPNEIADYDSEGLTVVTESGEATVRWEWIKDVYEALCHLGEIDAKDVQEGEFQTPGGYRGAFIFALLARFAHVEARTKPRRTLIYHEPEGLVQLRRGREDDSAGVEGQSP